jgi:hypothetical protein
MCLNPKGANVSKGPWNLKPTEVVRLVEAVKKATGLPVRNVEFSPETRLIRVNVGPPAEEVAIKSVESGTAVVL